MVDSKEWLINGLEEIATCFDKAADRCEKLKEHIFEFGEQEKMAKKAESYRAEAKHWREVINHVKESNSDNTD